MSVRSSSGDLRSWKCGLLVAARGCTMAGVDVRCQGWASALGEAAGGGYVDQHGWRAYVSRYSTPTSHHSHPPLTLPLPVTSLWNPWSYHADTAVRTAAVMVLAPEATLTACRILNSKARVRAGEGCERLEPGMPGSCIQSQCNGIATKALP